MDNLSTKQKIDYVNNVMKSLISLDNAITRADFPNNINKILKEATARTIIASENELERLMRIKNYKNK